MITSSSFIALKRRIYLITFAIASAKDAVVLLTMWEEPGRALPYAVALLVMSAMMLLLWKTEGSLRWVEVVTAALLFSLNVGSLYADLFVHHQHYGDVVYWVITTYLFFFLAFGSRGGLAICSVSFLIMLAFTTSHILKHNEPWDTFSLFHLSQVVTTLISYSIFSVKDQYIREVEELAHTDALVGHPNRRRLRNVLEAEITRANRYSRPLSLITIDVDDFKQINDTYGHDVGDEVLRRLVDLIASQLRLADQLGRWGGEEFLIITPETDLEHALRFAERIRRLIQRHTFPPVGSITASLGVAAYKSGEAPDDLIKRSDEAMYEAKRTGKNQVVALHHEEDGALRHKTPLDRI